MATIVTRAGKGTPLTNNEVDANFTNLNSDKLEVEVNDLTTSVTWTNVPDSYITASSVTQHQSVLTITESQISDLQNYLTSFTETNDLSTAVTWDNVPDAYLTQSSVKQHESALTITESQISDLQSYLTSETSHADVLVDGDFSTEGFMKTNGNGGYSVDATTYLSNEIKDEDDMSSNSATALATQQSIKAYVDSHTSPEVNDLTSSVTWADVPDTNVTQTSVTQHQGSLSITESQISDLQTYLTAETNDLSTSVTWANVPNANITESSVTQHEAALSITESQISDFGTYLTTHQDISGKANLSGATFTGTITAPNVDISTTGSVTTNIATGGNNGNTTDVKVVNIGTGYGAGFYAGLSTTINMGSQSSNAQNIFNIGNGTTSGFGENTINLKGNVTVSGTVDGVDVGNLKYHDVDYFMLRDGFTQNLSTSMVDIGTYTNIYDAATPVPTMRILDLTAEVNWLDTIYNGNTYQNDLEIRFQVIVPSGTTNAVSLGSVTQVTSSEYTVGSSYQKWFYVSGDVTHHFSDFGKIHENSSGGSFERTLYSYQYNPSQNRTYFSISTYPTVYANGTTVYWHPYQWESAGVLLTDYRYADEKGRSGQETLPFMCKTAYDDRNMTYRIKIRELSSSSTQPDKAQIGQTMLQITKQEP